MNHQQQAVDKPWPIYITLLFSCFFTIEAAAFQAPAMPTIAKHFGVTESLTALVVLCYAVASVSCSPVFGRIADNFGRKKVITAGLALFSAAEFAAAVSPTYALLLAARVLQGAAVACILPVVLSYVAWLFPQEKRGFPLGVLYFAMSLGGASGAIIGGYIIDWLGWRSIYWVSGIMGLAGLLLVLWRTPETPVSMQPWKLDIAGSLSLLLSVGALLSVPTWASQFGAFSLPALGALALGLAGLVALFRVEKRALAPVVDTTILANPTFLLPCAIYLLFLVCHGGSIYTLAFFVNNRPEGTASQVGLVNTFVFCSGMAAGLIGGKLIDWFAERTVIIGVILGMAGTLWLYSTIRIDTPLATIVLIAALLGFVQGIKGPAVTKLALSVIPAHRYTSGSGLFYMMRDFGSPAGVSIGLALFTSQRLAATDQALVARLQQAGLAGEDIAMAKQAFAQKSLAEFPALAQRLNELGVDFTALMTAAGLDGHAAALPGVGVILIPVMGVALLLALRLPKRGGTVPP